MLDTLSTTLPIHSPTSSTITRPQKDYTQDHKTDARPTNRIHWTKLHYQRRQWSSSDGPGDLSSLCRNPFPTPLPPLPSPLPSPPLSPSLSTNTYCTLPKCPPLGTSQMGHWRTVWMYIWRNTSGESRMNKVESRKRH